MAATWSELGKVHIWDLTRPLQAVNDSNEMATYTRNMESPPAIFTFAGHQTEGFAMDWSTTTAGKFLRNVQPWIQNSSERLYIKSLGILA